MKIYMFRTVRLSIIRSLFTVHSTMVYVIQVCRQLSRRTIWPQLLCPAVSRQINSSAWQVSLWQVVVYHRQTGAANRYQRRHSSWRIKGSLSHIHKHRVITWYITWIPSLYVLRLIRLSCKAYLFQGVFFLFENLFRSITWRTELATMI
jgi:hypothetical protein